MNNTLPVSEVFGPTIQGEGPLAGQRAAFIRLGMCNLTCGECDTGYAWDTTKYDLRREAPDITVSAIMGQVFEIGVRDLVVITGGEPLVHQRSVAFQSLISRLVEGGCKIQFETNGTLRPADWLGEVGAASLSYVVSPKITGGLATDPEKRRIRPLSLQWFAACETATFKIVCRSVEDVDQAVKFADEYGIARNRMWIMGEGKTWISHAARTRVVCDRAIAEGMNISPRLHLALWPTQQRGR